jgi:lipopolysaccharide export system permease protein
MKKLSKLVVLEFIRSTCVVACFVLLIQLLMMFLGELRYIGENNYTFYDALYFIASQSVMVLYSMLPMVCFIGALIGLGKLASTSELVVMQSSGYSMYRLLIVLLAASFTLLLPVFAVVQIWGCDWANQGQMQQLAWHGKENKLNDSVWLYQKKNYVHVETVINANLLRNVSIYVFSDDNSLSKIINAPSVRRVNAQWIAKSVSVFNFSQHRYNVKRESSVVLPVQFDYNNFVRKKSTASPYYNLLQIHRLIRFKNEMGNDTTDYRFLFWKEAMTPLIILVMTILSVPFVVRSMRAVTIGHQVFKGIVVGFGLYVLQVLIGNFALYFRFNPVIAALMPTLMFLLLFLLMMRKRV